MHIQDNQESTSSNQGKRKGNFTPLKGKRCKADIPEVRRVIEENGVIQSTALGALTEPVPKESRKRYLELNLTTRPVKKIASELSCSPGTSGGRLGHG